MTILYTQGYDHLDPPRPMSVPSRDAWSLTSTSHMRWARDWACFRSTRALGRRLKSVVVLVRVYAKHLEEKPKPSPRFIWPRFSDGSLRQTGKKLTQRAFFNAVYYGNLQRLNKWYWMIYVCPATGLDIHSPLSIEERPTWTCCAYDGSSQYADLVRQDVFSGVRPIPPTLYGR